MTQQHINHKQNNFDETFMNYLRHQELRIPQSTDGKIMGLTARNALNNWQTDISWVKASGQATLYSFVIYHQQYDPERPIPYNVALVELNEGPKLISTVVIDKLENLQVGMALQATFDKEGLLIFEPANLK